LTRSILLNTNSVHHSTGLEEPLNDFAIRAKTTGGVPRAQLYGSLALSRLNALSPVVSTVDSRSFAKRRRLRVTLGLSSLVLKYISTFHRSSGED